VTFTAVRDATTGCWRPDRVYRLAATGALEVFLDDPTGEFMTTPTNLAFGASDRQTLYLRRCRAGRSGRSGPTRPAST
jgi:hypothetical protein